MNKDEILAKSRASGEDEGEQYARQSGAVSGFFGMTFVYFALWFSTFIINEDKIKYLKPMDILYYLGWGFYWLFYGIRSKRKLQIVIGILFILAGLTNSIIYYIDIIG